MKNLGDMLVSTGPFSEVVIGNQAIVRAMIESGVRVVTSYPGSPTPEIAEAIKAIPAERNPMYFEFSTNEKVALEVAFGAALNGFTSCVFFKSVGMNVVADSFVQLSMMEIPGGMVVVVGDDPGANSSQNEQDNRHYARLSYTPMFEPKDAQEVYTMFKEAAEQAKSLRSAVILRLTTHTAHFKQKVKFGEYLPQQLGKPIFAPSQLGPYVPIGENVPIMKWRAIKRLQTWSEISEKYAYVSSTGNRTGVITAGLPYLSLLDVLGENANKIDILRLGMVYPLPRQAIIDFLKSHEEVKVLEELDDFIEEKVKAIAYEESIHTKIIGKLDLEDWMGEYTPEKVRNVMAKVWPKLVLNVSLTLSENNRMRTIPRSPQLCPGCGHRPVFYTLSKILAKDDISVADIGCHTLGFLEPYKVGQVLLSMGHSVGTGAGLSIFNDDRKVVAFLGDSTFFHAGIPGIINAVYNNHNLTLVIMENGTTAMTGHQDHPGKKIKIRTVLEALGVKHIWEVDTYQIDKLEETLKEALATKEFNVVIARHPCMLKFTRERRHRGIVKVPQMKVTNRCTLANVCITQFACPSFQKDKNGNVFVHEDLCIGDGSCSSVCPSGALEIEKFGGEQK
ncbi:MAG TPA: thiamine pyrophosphate-dependent enzyme [Fervidobacterium sp.]|mgnify:FL=1|nr:4Fe-4S binding protein [Fervidobacterium sp.]HOK33134.1 thiamine pyrophosphate-dependent enzyme [Fervidobacterium sp.]HOL03692.1 thiamine pyrophosphate-dependent enzyme [Fervidobacterium sp.]HON03698.1 thiamine pyrophosphate-dependent enzyme [Fervidobacterium sp.]HOP82352.1 thiamine pyrophosphate-dependent enzyme [Fervidobacterium sp.]